MSTDNNLLVTNDDYEVAIEQIVAFAEQFDEEHLDLAYHAAFPFVLTPELLYKIWYQFLPSIPWIAVARLLLSRLCREVGHELYEMNIVVRNLLLTELKEDARFGEQRLKKLADFLIEYINQLPNSDDFKGQDLAQVQYWTALAYTEPNKLSIELAEAIELRLKEKNWKELFRLGSLLVETFAEPLAEFGPLLITYARGIVSLTSGDTEKATEEFSRIPRQKEYIEIAGVNVPILGRVFLSAFGRATSSLTLYAFHLRNSINKESQTTVSEAPKLWEQLSNLGYKLDIPELKNLRQHLICYEDNLYSPEAEDSFGIEYLNLLRNQESSLNFQLSNNEQLDIQGLLCPFRLHDTYAIDLTLFFQDTFNLHQLSYLNPQYLLLPSQVQSSLGQTLLLFVEPSETHDNSQVLADTCLAEIIPQANSIDLVATGRLLGNPIFEYDNGETQLAQQLHILICLKYQNMNLQQLDKVSELILYLLWFRHKILYVYHQSRYCASQAKELYGRLEEYKQSLNEIHQSLNHQVNPRETLNKLHQMELESIGHLGHLAYHQSCIAINEQNYNSKLERLASQPETDLSIWQRFLNRVRQDFQQQIKVDMRELSKIYNFLIDEKSTILEWHFEENIFQIFIISSQFEDPIVWQSSSLDFSALLKWADEYFQDYQINKGKWLENLSQRLQKLAQILHLDEIVNYLPATCNQLILIPRRFLRCIPIHALPLADGSCLLERFHGGVRYAPTRYLLQIIQKRQRANFSHFFAIQNPNRDLGYTDIEVANITKYFSSVHLKLHAAAIKNSINNQTTSSVHCLHFSGKSTFNTNSPLESSLLLADEPVTLEEIFNLNLSQCRLVTLAASQTFLTNFTSASDEYISFASGFLIAGSTSVVGSLWVVNDLSTAFLMMRFYQNIGTGLTVAVALNQAQLWLRGATKKELERYITKTVFPLDATLKINLRRRFHGLPDDAQPFESPFYWAAFCDMGQ